MTALLVLLIVAGGVVLAALAYAVVVVFVRANRPSRLLSSRFRESVLVSCKDGTTFGGLLLACDARALVLRNAEAVGLGDNATNLPLDGEIIVLLADVAYLQRH